MQRWAIVITRADGVTQEVLSETYDSQGEAIEQAKRRCGWYRLVQVGVAPVTVNLNSVHEVTLEPDDYALEG